MLSIKVFLYPASFINAMADAAPAGSGGKGPLDRLKNLFKGVYFRLEDGYYAVMDALDGAGVPVYKYYVDPIESRGVPSFPVTVFLLLAFIAILLFAFSGLGSTADFEVTVLANGERVTGASVEVFDGELLLATGVTEGGVAVFDGLPAKRLQFTARKDTLEGTAFFETGRQRGLIDLSPASRNVRPPSTSTKPPKTIAPPAGGGFDVLDLCDEDDSCDRIVVPGGSNHSGQKGDVIAVLRDSATGRVVASAASARMVDAVSLKQINAPSNAVNGSAVFVGISYGRRFFLRASASGYFDYDGYALGLTFKVDSKTRTVTLLLDPADSANSVNTTISVKESGGGPLTGVFLQVYPKNAQLPISEGVVNGSRTYVLRQGNDYKAIATKAGYGRAVKEFTGQAGTVVMELNRNGSCTVGCNGTGEPALLTVNVTRQTPEGVVAVGASVVTALLKIGNSSTFCASALSAPDGMAEFPACIDQYGAPVFGLLTGDELIASANYYLGDETPILAGGPLQVTLAKTGGDNVNNASVPLVPETGRVNASTYDAISGGVTGDLREGRMRLVCQEPLFYAQGRYAFFATSSCIGARCLLEAPWIVNCRLFASAPNYFNSSDIPVPWIESAGQVVGVSVPMVPTSYGGSSIMLLDGLFDWQGRPIEQGSPLVKSFDYSAKFSLRGLNTSEHGIGAFLQADRPDGDCNSAGGCFFNHSQFPNMAIESYGYNSIDESCSEYIPLDYGSGNAFRALEIVSINDVEGRPYSGQFFASFRTNEQEAGANFSLHWRSYVVNNATLLYDPYDPDVLFNGKLACHANNYSESFTLASSQKSCSGDNSVCASLTYSQDTNPDNGRGDGFMAFSTRRCFEGNGSNPEACQPLRAVFTLEDSRSNTVRRPYFLSFRSNYSQVRPEKVVFTRVGNDAVTIEYSPNVTIDEDGFASFTVDADALLFRGRNKPPAAIVQGYVIAQPWLPAAEAPVQISYSAGSARAERNSWIVVSYNEHAVNQFGLLQWQPFTQLEQAGFERLGNGSFVLRTPFTGREPMPPADGYYLDGPAASLNDCDAAFPRAGNGWNCTVFVLNLSFESFQPYAAPNFSLAVGRELRARGVSYSLYSSDGSFKSSGSGPANADGRGAVLQMPAFEAGDKVVVAAGVDGVNSTGGGKAFVNASVQNGPASEGGVLSLESFVRVVPAYGTVRFKALDAFTLGELPGASVNGSFFGIPLACTTSTDPRDCAFRLRAFDDNYPDELTAWGRKSGYYASPAYAFSTLAYIVPGTRFENAAVAPLPLIPDGAGGSGQGSVSIALEKIVDVASGTPLCGIGGQLPECGDPSVFFAKNVSYRADLLLSFRNADWAGAAVSLAPFDGSAFFYNASSKLSGAGLDLPLANFTGGGSLDSCNANYYPRPQFFSAVRFGDDGSPQNGFAWMEFSGKTNGQAVAGKSFSTSAWFFIPATTDVSNLTFGSRAFSVKSGRYLRSPHDSALGVSRSVQGRDYCQAEQSGVQLRLRAPGASCTPQACMSFWRFAQFTPQGSLSESEGQPGFNAVSRPEWLRWQGEFPAEYRSPQPLNASFAIDLLSSLQNGNITFTIDAGHLEFKAVTFSKYCGSTSGPKVNKPLAANGPLLSVDVSDCADFASSPDFVGVVELWPTALTQPNSQAGIEAGVSSGQAQLSSAGTSTNVVSPVSESQTMLFGPLSVRQRHPSNDQPCSDGNYSYTCGENRQYFTVSSCFSGNDFTRVENTYGNPGVWGNTLLTCPDSYIELNYSVTSRVSTARGVLTFNLTGPSADFAMRAYLERQGAGRLTYDFAPGQKMRQFAVNVDNVASGEKFHFTVLVAPMAAGKVTGNLTFGNGGSASRPVSVPYVDNRASDPLPPGLGPNALFCGGSAAVIFRAVRGPDGEPVPVAGCANVTMQVDSILPADAMPFEVEPSYNDLCPNAINSLLVNFAPVQGYTDPRSSGVEFVYRAIDGVPVVIVNAKNLLKGNTFFRADDPRQPTPAGDFELGRLNMSVGCTGTGKKTSVVLILKKQDLDGVTALDGSYIFGKGQAHQVVYTLYNGQYPANLKVIAEGAQQRSDVRTTVNYPDRIAWTDAGREAEPVSRLLYWLMSDGTGQSGTDSQRTYPLDFYPSTGAKEDGIVIADPNGLNAYRQDSLLSRLVIMAHSAHATNALYTRFTNEANGNPANVVQYTCDATAYVSDVMSQVPSMFKLTADQVARSSAFRRSPLSLGDWLCAERRDTHTTACYPSPLLWVNATIVQQFGTEACTACADVSGPVDVSYGPDPAFTITPSPSNAGSVGDVPYFEMPSDFSLSSYREAALSVSLEFKQSGNSACPMEDGNSVWCDGTGANKFLNSYDDKSLSFANDSWAWSKQFVVAADGSGDGTWAARPKAGVDGGGSAYSKPIIVVISAKSRACHPEDNEGRVCGTPWCTPDCRNGSHRIVISAGPMDPSDPNYWINATPLRNYNFQPVGNLEPYWGAPFKYVRKTYFSDASPRNFSLSLPLSTWGWNAANLVKPVSQGGDGFSPEDIMCNAGIGLYELKVSSFDGRAFDYRVALKRLPTKQYLLGKEPSDSAGSEGTYLYRGNGGGIKAVGCSIKTEIGGKVRFVRDSTGNELQQITVSDDKYLCNIKQVGVSKHTHSTVECGGMANSGCGECVQVCTSAYCGNCGGSSPNFVFCPVVPKFPEVMACASGKPAPTPLPQGYSGFCFDSSASGPQWRGCEAPMDESIRVHD